MNESDYSTFACFFRHCKVWPAPHSSSTERLESRVGRRSFPLFDSQGHRISLNKVLGVHSSRDILV